MHRDQIGRRSRRVWGVVAAWAALTATGLTFARSAPAGAAVAPPAIVPIVPGRLLDTRPGEATVDGVAAGSGALGAGQVLELTVAGRHGIPADAAAVMLNVTAVAPDAPGYLTVWPCGESRPRTSSVNYRAGQVVPNAVLSKVGAGGAVCIMTLATSHVLADATGFVPAGGGVATLVPGRLLDTRSGQATVDAQYSGVGRIAAGAVLELPVGGRHGIPGDAAAAMLNVTAVAPDAAGYLTVFPCGAPRPRASSVNYLPGQVVPNAVLAQVGAGGNVCIFSLAASDVLVDVSGYVPAGGGVSTVVPGRLLDTRPGETTVDGQAAGQGFVSPGGVVELQVAGRHGVPGGAAAVMLNVTAVAPDAAGYLTVWPCGAPRPRASSVNYVAGQVVPNAVLAQVGAGGKVCVFTLAGAHVIADVTAFVPAPDGGGTGGGGGGTGGGGGGGAAAGAASFIRPLPAPSSGTSAFENQNVTIGPDGTAHLVYVDGWGTAAWYARCQADCSTTAGWTHTQLFSIDPDATSGAGTGGVGVDAAGRVHALFDGWGWGGWSLRYATCAAGCGTAANWTFTDITEGSTPTSADTSAVLMVDPDGSLALVASGFDANVDWEVKYIECASACTSAASWTEAGVFLGYPVMATRDTAGMTHLLFQPSNLDGDQLRYARCASDCSNPVSWTVAAGSYPAFHGASIGVTTSGRVLIGYLQPELGDAHDRRFVVRSCAGTCDDLSAWPSFTVGVDWEGWDGAWIATTGEEVLLVTTAADDLLGRFCESACDLPGSYGQPVVLDTRVAIGADVNPWFHAETDLCSSADPNWWAQNPTVARTGDRLVVAHNPYATYVCPPSNLIFDLPAIGRVRSNF